LILFCAPLKKIKIRGIENEYHLFPPSHTGPNAKNFGRNSNFFFKSFAKIIFYCNRILTRAVKKHSRIVEIEALQICAALEVS